MTLSTLLKYLAGNRDAILTIARCPSALWIGFLFVVAAGFAREYDGEDLLHEPWHLLIPLGASLASSAVLYLLVRLIAWLRGAAQPTMVSGYLTFLTLYWMTAPLALVYAIPFERFLSAADATRANLGLLGVVAIWRVILMARVISVLYNASMWATGFLVMLFADSVLLAILVYTPLPLLSIMGGVRLSESEMVLQGTTLLLQGLGILSWPIWLVGGIAAAVSTSWNYEPTSRLKHCRVSLLLWTVCGVTLGVWGFVLPLTQPEQILRRRVEIDLGAGHIREALELMSKHEQDDFPPHWDPPPRIAYLDARPDIAAILETAQAHDLKPWVRKMFADKFVNSLHGRHSFFGVWENLSATEAERRLQLIESLPNAAEAAVEVAQGLRFLEGREDMPGEVRQHAKRLLELAAQRSEAAQQKGEPDAKSNSP